MSEPTKQATQESWRPEQTEVMKASRYKPSSLAECAQGLAVARMVGSDTCNAADVYIRQLEAKLAFVELLGRSEDPDDEPCGDDCERCNPDPLGYVEDSPAFEEGK